MKIEKTNEFELNQIDYREGVVPSALLKHVQLNKKVVVTGSVLEAQYVVGNHFLLIMSEGNPLEEALYIYFLDKELAVKDALELSVEYTSGIFKNVSIVNSLSIMFSFFENDDAWLLTVLNSPAYQFFKNTYPVKRHLSIFQKSWITLTKV